MSKIDFSKVMELASRKLDMIVMHSQKGGPGKTTLSCNIAYELAKRGHKTALVDLDVAQPTIQHIFRIPDKEIKCTINEILLGEANVSDDLLIKTENPNLFLITAQKNIEYGEGLLSLIEKIQKHAFFTLHEMSRLLMGHGFRYLIYDCAPGYRMESVSAASVADARVFVIRPSTFSYAGAKLMLEDIYTKLDPTSLNFFLYNQVPPDLKKENQQLLKNWKNDILKMFKPNKIEFLGNLNSSFEIMENGIQGNYVFPEDSNLYQQFTKMVDEITSKIDKMKAEKLSQSEESSKTI